MANKQSKRAPGGNPALSFFVLLAGGMATALALVAIPALGWWTLESAGWFMNPIDRFIYLRLGQAGGAGSAQMIPEVFSSGESGVIAGRRLIEAGYFMNGGTGGMMYFMHTGRPPYRVLCHTNYHVTLSIDVDGNLTEALAQTSATCV
jgi:hypothetical protein